jgi:hypothetical protein
MLVEVVVVQVVLAAVVPEEPAVADRVVLLA